MGFWASLFGNVNSLARANSPEFRLQMANLWTEIQRVKDGGATQMMKMEDGNIILLSVGAATTKIFVAPNLDSIGSFTEIGCFPLRSLNVFPHVAEDALNKLRPAIGWPKSIDELRVSVSKIEPGILLS
jgi:hypothetical protein